MEYRKKVTDRLNLICKIDGECHILPPHLLNWDGRPKHSFLYLGKSVFPYTASWALNHNNGNLPPKLVDGTRSMIMHDDERCVHRPNCCNPAHLKLGNSSQNMKTAHCQTGEKRKNAIFSDVSRKKILELWKQNVSLDSIQLEFPTYRHLQIYDQRGKKTIKKKNRE